MRTLLSLALVHLMLLTGACASSTPGDPQTQDDQNLPEKGTELTSGKADRWSDRDAPSLFSDDLEYDLNDLPLEGAAVNTPWAGTYWPVYKDSINDRWNGSDTQSPAAKYGEAFGIEGLEDIVSKHHGIDSFSNRKECESNSDCDGETQAAEGKCAKRHDAEKGRCIPTWWGLCHAWAPAAILEPEPVHPVTRNGVEFKVNDIKALVELMYNRSTSKFLSLRCNEQGSDIATDEYGNPTGDDIECKDTNAGTFHIVVANYLGLKGESFVEDRTYDDEVWNQPVSAYRVTQMNQVTAKEANELAGAKENDGSNIEEEMKTVEGEVEKGAWFDAGSFEIPKDAKVSIQMNTEGDADLYVRWGSAPNDESYTCRPYTSDDIELCELTNTSYSRKLYVKAYGYEAATFTISVTTQGLVTSIPDTYIWNEDATKFYHVKTELDYIAESDQHTDGNLSDTIATYTKTDRYEYILEVNDRDEIIGGEWVGSSKKHHPDFLWLPTGRSHESPAGGKITYAQVKALLDASIAGETDLDEASGPTTVTENGSVQKKEWRHFGPFDVGQGDIEVLMTGTGDADLYVRKGSQPDDSTYDCRPYLNGSDERCTLTGPGAFFVSVQGYSSQGSDFSLSVTFVGEGAGDAPLNNAAINTAHLNESGTLSQGEMKYYTLDVSAGRAVVVKTEAPQDIDVYVKMHQAPTTASYDKRGYTVSGHEKVIYTPSAAGTLHVMVHGYTASDFTLTTEDQ